jgi:hypothetical protein
MHTTQTRRLIALGVFAAAIFAGAQGAAAAPTINVTVMSVSESNRQVQVRVTGSGFAPWSWHEFYTYYGYSNEFAGARSLPADSAGRVDLVELLPYNNACRLTIQALDLITFGSSNSVDLGVPAPCKMPTITVTMHNNERDATYTEGVNFTPPEPGGNASSRAASYVWDFTTGESWYNDDLPVFWNGKTGFHRHWGTNRCGHTLLIYMLDRTTQVWSNGVAYRLCP